MNYEKIWFWFWFGMFSLLCLLFGFMIGDMHEIIAASSETIFKWYLWGCELAALGSLYFIITSFNKLTSKTINQTEV